MTGAGSSPDCQVWSVLGPGQPGVDVGDVARPGAPGGARWWSARCCSRPPSRTASVRTQGRNSARWRSPAAAIAPHRSSRVSFSSCRWAKSSRENGSASGRSGPGASAASPPGRLDQVAQDVEAVLAVDLEGGHHREVVDPADRRPHRLGRPAQGDGQVQASCPPRGTDPTVLRTSPAHRPGEGGHRVGDVEQPGIGALLVHVAADAHQHRDVAQRPVDAAGTDGVAHRLADRRSGRARRGRPPSSRSPRSRW